MCDCTLRHTQELCLWGTRFTSRPNYWLYCKLNALIFFFFTSIGPCIVINFFIIKPTRCTNFTNLFWHETLHVSDSSSAHHQDLIHCTLDTGICHTGLKTAFEQDHHGPAWKLSSNQNKVVKLVHLVGFVIKKLIPLIKHHAMKANRVVKMQLHAFLTSTLDTELSVLRHSSFAPRG